MPEVCLHFLILSCAGRFECRITEYDGKSNDGNNTGRFKDGEKGSRKVLEFLLTIVSDAMDWIPEDYRTR